MLSQKKRQVAILAATTNLKNYEIADKLNLHFSTVSRILKMPEVQQLIEQLQASINEKVVTDLSGQIDQAALEALEKLKELMRNGPPAVSFRAAESLLDRSQVSPKRQIHSKHEVDKRVIKVHIGGAKLERMHQALIEDAGEDVNSIPELPVLENKNYKFEIDPSTGKILKEGIKIL